MYTRTHTIYIRVVYTTGLRAAWLPNLAGLFFVVSPGAHTATVTAPARLPPPRLPSLPPSGADSERRRRRRRRPTSIKFPANLHLLSRRRRRRRRCRPKTFGASAAAAAVAATAGGAGGVERAATVGWRCWRWRPGGGVRCVTEKKKNAAANEN